jgi:ABC-type polysaccharide/polyol phosphate transport system ATPase subunit
MNAVRQAVPVVQVDRVSKVFPLPTGRTTSMRERAQHPLRRTRMERQYALRDVSLTIARGEFVGIIGPNGSGKTTLLKIIAGIYRPDSGGVRISGMLSPFIELGVGFNPELSARDNLRVNATLLGLTKDELDDRFDRIVAFAELERFVDQKLKNFSSGMQVRLAFSIAIHVEFDILLLDEVLAVGDEAFQQRCFATFDEMRRQGKTMILVSHSLPAVMRFCDRALLLRAGAVEAVGSPPEVVETYLNRESQQEAPPRPRQPVLSGNLVAGGPHASEVAFQDPRLAQAEKRIRGLEAKLADRGRRLEQLGELEELRAKVRAQDALLEEREQRTNDQEPAQLEKRIRGLEVELADRERRIAELAAEADALRNLVESHEQRAGAGGDPR